MRRVCALAHSVFRVSSLMARDRVRLISRTVNLAVKSGANSSNRLVRSLDPLQLGLSRLRLIDIPHDCKNDSRLISAVAHTRQSRLFEYVHVSVAFIFTPNDFARAYVLI